MRRRAARRRSTNSCAPESARQRSSREGSTVANNLERVLRLMAEKSASDVYMSANMPIQIKINGAIHQLSDQLLGIHQTRQLLSEMLAPQQLEELDDTGELNVGIGVPRVGSFRLSAFKQRRQHRGGDPLHSGGDSHARFTGRAGDAVHAGDREARPDPDGGRHRYRQEHHAGLDAGMAQPADARAHPDHRRPDRVPVLEQEEHRQPARGGPRHPKPAGGAAQCAAPGA